ncbi:MAG: hypothetical protein HZB76_04975 [Chlamydiae bacterium]|nr:hypothetical protein [Chlamydiota bacterium]
MNLEVDVTWNNKKNKSKVVISYKNEPKSLFLLNDDDLLKLKNLENTFLMDGPNSLKEFEKIYLSNPKSLYAIASYYLALKAYEYEEEALEVFKIIKKKFSKEVLTKCITAHNLLENREENAFIAMFSNLEVLKAVFPKRKLFYFKEAFLFHSAWQKYFFLQRNAFQAQKHANFVNLILNPMPAKNNLPK